MIGTLTLDQLRIPVAIADTGSFSAAGRALGRAQSAISQSIAGLEAVQGVTIFNRSGYRPTLTHAGRTLVAQARLVLSSAARFEAVAGGIRGGLEPELRLAVDPLVPSDRLTDALRELRSRFPDLPVAFSTEGLGGALRRLRLDTTDLAICLLLPAVPGDILARPILQMAMKAVAAPVHPLARIDGPLTRDDLAPYIQLVLSDPSGDTDANYGLLSERRWRFVDLGRRLDFLHAGLGWCRMPDHMIEASLSDGRLVALDLAEDDPQAGNLVIHAAHRFDRTPGPAGRWLLERLSGSEILQSHPERPSV